MVALSTPTVVTSPWESHGRRLLGGRRTDCNSQCSQCSQGVHGNPSPRAQICTLKSSQIRCHFSPPSSQGSAVCSSPGPGPSSRWEGLLYAGSPRRLSSAAPAAVEQEATVQTGVGLLLLALPTQGYKYSGCKW